MPAAWEGAKELVETLSVLCGGVVPQAADTAKIRIRIG
jgi:hypothetical protein